MQIFKAMYVYPFILYLFLYDTISFKEKWNIDSFI